MRETRDEAGRRRTVPALGEHLMQRAAREATLQRRIGFGMAERRTVECAGIGRAFHAFDAAAQMRKRGRACAGHAPLL
jgi:hypothetical protein